MNRFLFCGKYLLILFMINFFNFSVFGKQRDCVNYPYPDGIYLKNNLINKKQLIFLANKLKNSGYGDYLMKISNFKV